MLGNAGVFLLFAYTMNNMASAENNIRNAAEELAGSRVHTLHLVRSGGNSQIFRIETAAGLFALKAYPSRLGDTRNRAEVEWKTLRFLHSRGVRGVPTPFACNTASRLLLMEWIDGTPVTSHTKADLEQATHFISELFALSFDREAGDFPFASEACLSAANIIEQIESRLAMLATAATLQSFLTEVVHPMLASAKSKVERATGDNVQVPRPFQRLIPADLGFHNALREADGRVRFVDFEYFGWDDPVKLAADLLLHPAMQLNAQDATYFIDTIAGALPLDADFRARLRRRLPLFALRWMLIVFNPFRRDRSHELPHGRIKQENLLDDRLTRASIIMDQAAVLDRLIGFQSV
jgi:hypothetical protein